MMAFRVRDADSWLPATPRALTPEGWVPPRGGSEPPTGILYVASAAPATASEDLATLAALASLGFTDITEVTAENPLPLEGIGVVIVSFTAEALVTDLTSVPVPAIGMNHSLWESWGLCSNLPTAHDDQTEVVVTSAGASILGTAAGTEQWWDPAVQIRATRPDALAPGAAGLAHVVGDDERFCVVVAEQGASLVSGTAPARRAGYTMSLGTDSPQRTTQAGWAAFGALIDWMLEPVP